MAKELSDAVHEKIQKLCAEGDELADADKYKEAIQRYNQALELVPDPMHDWEASTWIMSAIGDAFFALRMWKEAHEALTHAVQCPGGLGNPFVHLRLGQVQLELGNLPRAADEMTRAYALEGKEIFEDEDKKYWEFLKTKIKLPPEDKGGGSTQKRDERRR